MVDTNFETISCPICNCNETKLMFKTKDFSYNNEGPYFIVKCNKCSFVFQNPRPKFEYLWKFYPKGEYFTIPYDVQSQKKHSEKLDIFNKRSFFSNIARSIIQNRYCYEYNYSGIYLFIGKLLNNLFGNILTNLTFFQRPHFIKNGKLLEVGFGTCSDLIQFRNEGWDTTGADVDEDCCNYAREKLNFEIAKIDQFRISCLSDSFDVIYLSQTLEHLSFLNESILEYNRLLKNNGQLIMKFPNINCLQARIFKSKWRGIEAPRHLSYFSKKSVKRLLYKNGFKNVEIRSVNLSPFDIFCANVPPTIRNNKLHENSWWNNRVISSFLQLFAPYFGLGESIYVTARK